MAYNKDRIRELKLIASPSPHGRGLCCSDILGVDIDECVEIGCSECRNQYEDAHINDIMKEEKWECPNTCEYITNKFGLNILTSCEDCQKEVEKYLKEDFREVFNNLKEGKK